MRLSMKPTVVQPKSSIDSYGSHHGWLGAASSHCEHSLKRSSATTFSTEMETRLGEKGEVLCARAGRFQRLSRPFGTRWGY